MSCRSANTAIVCIPNRPWTPGATTIIICTTKTPICTHVTLSPASKLFRLYSMDARPCMLLTRPLTVISGFGRAVRFCAQEGCKHCSHEPACACMLLTRSLTVISGFGRAVQSCAQEKCMRCSHECARACMLLTRPLTVSSGFGRAV